MGEEVLIISLTKINFQECFGGLSTTYLLHFTTKYLVEAWNHGLSTLLNVVQ
jgi:hypothetical protein